MTPALRKLFIAYLNAHGGKWCGDFGCDICRYHGAYEQTKAWITTHLQQSGFSSVQPDLCTKHAQELGLIW